MDFGEEILAQATIVFRTWENASFWQGKSIKIKVLARKSRKTRFWHEILFRNWKCLQKIYSEIARKLLNSLPFRHTHTKRYYFIRHTKRFWSKILATEKLELTTDYFETRFLSKISSMRLHEYVYFKEQKFVTESCKDFDEKRSK